MLSSEASRLLRVIVQTTGVAGVFRQLMVDPDSSPSGRITQGLPHVVEVVQGAEVT
jgi:hypothetical protein